MSSSARICPKCGVVLPSTAAEGLCPRCLYAQLEDAIALEGVEPNAEGSRVGSVASEGGSEREFGDYELLEEIGEGGMGVVYRARQKSLNRPVAVKVVKLGMDTRKIIARFEAERQALALMDHPAIARVFDAGATRTGRPYFAMELIRGVKITHHCEGQKLSTRQRLELFTQVCHAVQHAHQKGIIHRDLKPSNILVTEQEGRPLPKIIDFGIAKATEGRLTEDTLVTVAGQFIGTPAYQSPEQAEWGGVDIDTRSDIYSLGVLLYELLTGCLPFEPRSLAKANFEEVRRAIREVEPVKPSTRLTQEIEAAEVSPLKSPEAGEKSVRADSRRLLQEVRGDLDWIVMKCLEKNRARRYETADGLAADIQRHLNNEPITARPPSRLYEFQKTVRRHWVGFGAAAAVMVVLAAGLVGVAWQWRRAEANQLLAQQNAYAADMQLAQQSVDRGDLGGALRLLTKYRPDRSGGGHAKRAASDLRGWEWRYLWQLCQSDEESTLVRYPSWVGGVVVATNLNLLAVQRGDGWITLWDLKGRREITNLPAAGSRDTIGYSAKSSLLVAANVRTNGQAEVRLWNLKNLSETTALIHEAPVISLSLTPDGRLLATRDSQDLILVWDIESGKELARFEAEGIGGWTTEGWRSGRLLQLSPDGTRLAYRDGRDRIRVLDWRSGADAVPPVSSPTLEPVDNRMLNQITALAFSPDGKLLLWGHGSGTIYLWDLVRGEMAGHLNGHDNWVFGMTFSPDGRRLVSAGLDQTIRVWRLDELTEVRRLRGHEYSVLAVAWLPEGEALVSGGKDGSVRTWNINEGRPTAAHRVLPVLFPTFTPDGRQILMMDSNDGSIGIWDARTMQLTKTLTELGTNNYVFDLSSDERWLAVNNRAEPKRIRILTWPSLEEVTNLFLFSRPIGVNFSPGSRKLFVEYHGGPSGLTGGQTTEVKRWAVGSWEEGPPARRPFKAYFRAGAVSEDESLAALGYETGEIEIIEPATGKLVHALEGFSSRVQIVRFSRGGNLLAAASLDEFVRLWDVSSGRELMTLRGDMTYINSIAFSPDGSRLAVGGVGGTNSEHRVKLWDLATQREVLDLPGGYANVGFSPNGEMLTVVETSLRSYVSHFWRAPSWEEIEAFERSRGSQVPQPASP